MATHHSVKSFCAKHQAYTPAALRYILFTRGPELAKRGAVIKLGRKVVVLEERLLLTGANYYFGVRGSMCACQTRDVRSSPGQTLTRELLPVV